MAERRRFNEQQMPISGGVAQVDEDFQGQVRQQMVPEGRAYLMDSAYVPSLLLSGGLEVGMGVYSMHAVSCQTMEEMS